MQCARVRARLTYAYKALRSLYTSQPVDFTTASRFFSRAVAVPASHQMQRLAAKVHHFTEESRENHHFLAQSVYLLHDEFREFRLNTFPELSIFFGFE